MKAPEPFHRHYPAGAQGFRGDHDRGLAARQRVSGGIQQFDLRSADRAGVGLGVITPIGRIIILVPADGTHAKAGHGRVRPVVRQLAEDRVARPAVGAVDEWIRVPAIGGVPEFPPAVLAQCQVGRDRGGGRGLGRTARHDDKAGTGRRGGRLDLPVRQQSHRGNPGGGRRLRAQPGGEILQHRGRRAGADRDSVAIVADPPAHSEARRQPGHERPESHPLHGAGDDNDAIGGGHDRREWSLPVTEVGACLRANHEAAASIRRGAVSLRPSPGRDKIAPLRTSNRNHCGA